MNWFRPLGTAGLAWRNVALVVNRGTLWAPVLIAALAQALVLLLLTFFPQPGLVWVGGPLVRALGGEAATHYPGHVAALPLLFDRASFWIDVLLAWVVWGVATRRFAAAFGLQLDGEDWPTAGRAAVVLGAVALVSAAARWGVGVALAPAGSPSRVMRLAYDMCELGLTVAIQGVLIYAAAAIVLRGRSLHEGIGDALRVLRRSAAPTLILVAVAAAVQFPLTWFARECALAPAPRPELIAATLGLRVLVGALMTFVLVGSITRLYLSKTRELR